MQQAINNPVKHLSSVTVNHVDVMMLKHQALRIHGLLTQPNLRLHNEERDALRGVSQLLLCMVEVAESDRRHKKRAPKRISSNDVNRIRDLAKCGKSVGGISQQLGYQKLAISRVLAGKTYSNVRYTPTEFAPPTKKMNGKKDANISAVS